jgi:tRNA (guanine-N(7)-)-methyltransferase
MQNASETQSSRKGIIRTYRRRGRMTSGRVQRWEQLSPQYHLSTQEVTAWRPTVLDIGFGSGESTYALATGNPHERVLGVEVHEVGIVALMTTLADGAVDNARIWRGDAQELFPVLLQGSLNMICVFFPDPWPKVRHGHRRLVQSHTVRVLAGLLRPGGMLHLATDAALYADQMRMVCSEQPNLVATTAPQRVGTKYERAGLDAGRLITDLAYIRHDSASCGDVEFS